MMGILTDFHSHVLPGIDDGSADLEESLALLKMQAEQGITRVVATPHFYARRDNLDAFLQYRDAAEAALREAMAKRPGLPELVVGAEVHFFTGISRIESLSRLTIAGTNHILIEMPMAPWREDMYHELEQIREEMGLVPIIAHVDRYISPWRSHGIPKRLEKMPVLVQANGEFFLNRSTAAMALRMLKENRVHLLGSDCHNLRSRKPNLGPAAEKIARKCGEAALDRINGNAELVIRGEAVSGPRTQEPETREITIGEK